MSAKQLIHEWIDEMPDDSPALHELYEQARLDRAIGEAMEDVRAGRMLTYEQLMEGYEKRCRERASS